MVTRRWHVQHPDGTVIRHVISKVTTQYLLDRLYFLQTILLFTQRGELMTDWYIQCISKRQATLVYSVSDCGSPSPVNGQAVTPDGTTYGSAATITCDSGYALVGNSYLTCQNGSSWSQTPTCVRGRNNVCNLALQQHDLTNVCASFSIDDCAIAVLRRFISYQCNDYLTGCISHILPHSLNAE